MGKNKLIKKIKDINFFCLYKFKIFIFKTAAINTRIDQIETMKEFINDKRNEGEISFDDKIILMGDFNIDALNFHKFFEVKFKEIKFLNKSIKKER